VSDAVAKVAPDRPHVRLATHLASNRRVDGPPSDRHHVFVRRRVAKFRTFLRSRGRGWRCQAWRAVGRTAPSRRASEQPGSLHSQKVPAMGAWSDDVTRGSRTTSNVVPANAGTHTPRPIDSSAVLDYWLLIIDARGYGSLLSQGRRDRGERLKPHLP
jgi:hypothetical protein